MSVITWTNELTDTLIDLYRAQSVLWDSSDEGYKNKNKKKDAWKTITDVMGLHEFEFEIQRKIKNLTAQFFREKKKIKGDNKSAAAASDTPKWFAYKRLLYFTDRNEPRLCVEKGLNETRHSEAELSQNQLPNEDDTTVQSPPDPQPPN
ncbi:hypothetical protein FQA39_LY10420 [Lamprigera yunnana]|nr:hypothetical protein FQA39_LY10420 [Lamprigera yunnana]